MFQNAPNAPIVLVGTKSDLKKQYESDPARKGRIVTEQEGLGAVSKHNLFKYIETSAKTQDNLNRLFSDGIRAVFNYRQLRNQAKVTKKSRCAML